MNNNKSSDFLGIVIFLFGFWWLINDGNLYFFATITLIALFCLKHEDWFGGD